MLPICDSLQLHITFMQHKDLLLYYQQSLVKYLCLILDSLYMHITQHVVTGNLVIILLTSHYIQRKGYTGRQYFMLLVYHKDLLPMNKVL